MKAMELLSNTPKTQRALSPHLICDSQPRHGSDAVHAGATTHTTFPIA